MRTISAVNSANAAERGLGSGAIVGEKRGNPVKIIQAVETMNTQICGGPQIKLPDGKHDRLVSVFGLESFRPGEMEERPVVPRWTPFMKITENEQGFLLTVELPEMKRLDVKILVEDGVLVVSGERRFGAEERARSSYRLARQFGSFVRTFALPPGTSGERITADFKDGMLRVRLVKVATSRSTRVEAMGG